MKSTFIIKTVILCGASLLLSLFTMGRENQSVQLSPYTETTSRTYSNDGDNQLGQLTLEEAVDTMVWVQLNRRFSEEGRGKIVAFLKSLTGKQPSITLPQLPPSGPDTPAPDPWN